HPALIKVGALLDQRWVPARDKGAYADGIVGTAVALGQVLIKDAQAGGDAAPTEESRKMGNTRGASGGETNAAALGLAILAMLAVLVVLASSAMRRSFPGKTHGYLALGL